MRAIGFASGFLISDDGGKNWTKSNQGLPPMDAATSGIWGLDHSLAESEVELRRFVFVLFRARATEKHQTRVASKI